MRRPTYRPTSTPRILQRERGSRAHVQSVASFFFYQFEHVRAVKQQR